MVRNQGQEALDFQLLFPEIRRSASQIETSELKPHGKLKGFIIRS
jgi:hypothetical protein